MNKKHLIILVSLLFSAMTLLSSPLAAAKPDGAGNGKKMEKSMKKEQQRADKLYRKEDKLLQRGLAKEERVRERETSREEKKYTGSESASGNGEPRGLEKQRLKKAEQEQKELGKGSEQGQLSRENRRKWWKFWE